jgi:hypothetical protein
METANTAQISATAPVEKISRWRIAIVNILSLVIGYPILAVFGFFMYGDSGNISLFAKSITLFVASLTSILVILSIIISQVRRSGKWAGIGLFATFIPIAFGVLIGIVSSAGFLK